MMTFFSFSPKYLHEHYLESRAIGLFTFLCNGGVAGLVVFITACHSGGPQFKPCCHQKIIWKKGKRFQQKNTNIKYQMI